MWESLARQTFDFWFVEKNQMKTIWIFWLGNVWIPFWAIDLASFGAYHFGNSPPYANTSIPSFAILAEFSF